LRINRIVAVNGMEQIRVYDKTDALGSCREEEVGDGLLGLYRICYKGFI
jgi:hypothetical protein